MQELLMTALIHARTLQQSGQGTEELQRRLDAITELFASTEALVTDLDPSEIRKLQTAVDENVSKLYQENFGYPLSQASQARPTTQPHSYGHMHDIPLQDLNPKEKGKGRATKEDHARWAGGGSY
jgi:hypothetical protein